MAYALGVSRTPSREIKPGRNDIRKIPGILEGFLVSGEAIADRLVKIFGLWSRCGNASAEHQLPQRFCESQPWEAPTQFKV